MQSESNRLEIEVTCDRGLRSSAVRAEQFHSIASEISVSCENELPIYSVSKPEQVDKKCTATFVTRVSRLTSICFNPVHPNKNEFGISEIFERGLRSIDVKPVHCTKKFIPTAVTCESGLRSTEVRPAQPIRKFFEMVVTCDRGPKSIVLSIAHPYKNESPTFEI